jgi:hypothetical protein
MTALDRQLVKTFRLARWNESAGRPICADCFDGDDLAEPTDDPMTPGLSRYRCTVCHTEFSDVKGTVFDSRKPVPLRLWAYLVLMGDPRRLGGDDKHAQRCFDLMERLKGRVLPALWREQLAAAGTTTEQLRKKLSATTRRAA